MGTTYGGDRLEAVAMVQEMERGGWDLAGLRKWKQWALVTGQMMWEVRGRCLDDVIF